MPLLPSGREPLDWTDFGTPLLVAEVTSPATARYDRVVKRYRFQRSGVAEYWIVDADARTFERWTPDDVRPEVSDESVAWLPPFLKEPLRIDLRAYFRYVWGE
ncbi:MAG: Uma2 family endonuclease [Gemmatimonadota bacterium]